MGLDYFWHYQLVEMLLALHCQRFARPRSVFQKTAQPTRRSFDSHLSQDTGQGACLFLEAVYRKTIETTGCLIECLLPKSIQAVAAEGFELKVVLVVLVSSVNFMLPTRYNLGTLIFVSEESDYVAICHS